MQGVKDSSAHGGCYTLVICLRKNKRIQVGSLGSACFPSGIYCYTGSAMVSLSGRLSRHLRKRNKKSRWHIDYLLRSSETHVKKVLIYPSTTRQECRQNRRIAALPGAKVILKGFGASDCTSGCASHLLFFARENIPEGMKRLLNNANNHAAKEDQRHGNSCYQS